MIIFPAIDLKDGVCVRLKKGVMADATVFNTDPAAQARKLCRPGLPMAALRRSERRLCRPQRQHRGDQIHPRRHRSAHPAGRRHPRHGGGGSLAGRRHHPRDPGHRRPDRSAIRERRGRANSPAASWSGADAKGGKIATQGWAEVSELTPVELGKRFEDAGVAAILFTDIDGDGLLKGVNVTATAALARALSIPVIASGGVGSIADIDALLAASEPNIEGVVVGRALYDGRIDVAEALARAG